ncbi:hypothetical protein [Hydrogenivirga sp. 128-5-R1-1]|uniref:hypothetical protein n=1 Tax=Hydrogenivirga sp. 128-5-R1-1 TaxID=392423 RepID=UPI00015F18FA|nr:hypothetical protein [Hydrogenivirga sp. 128-5-R1-1]EDP75365.1 hypothetical protein HG1285_15411 [Hydrogenivirga sp. 128-5-R1-1]
MKVVDVNTALEKIKEFLEGRGVKIKDMYVWEHDEGVLIQVYTINIRSMKNTTKLEKELWKIIPDEEISILIYPVD